MTALEPSASHSFLETLKLPPRSFCLIRHGETTANRDALIAGRLDVPLTDSGRQQAKSLAAHSWPLSLQLFASPLSRAKDTCELAFPGQPYQIHPDLRERNWGLFEGQPLPEAPDRNAHPPAGESWPAMQARVCRALHSCCDLTSPDLPVLVCHSGVIRATRLLAGQPCVGQRPAHCTPHFFLWTGSHHLESETFSDA